MVLDMKSPRQYRLAPPPGFGGAPALWISSSSSSQATAAAAAAEAKERATKQMAYEDAWKAINPFRTPFASVEDAVSRLLPYHVFVDNGEEDMDDAHLRMMKSSAKNFTDEMEDKTLHMVAEFEQQVLAFKVIARGHAEEPLMLEYGGPRRHGRQARAEARAASMAQGDRFQGLAGQRMETPGVAMSRGEGFFPGLAGHPQHDPAATRAWQMMMMMMQQQQQQQHQQQQQKKQQHQQQQLGMGVCPTLLEPHGEGTSSGLARARALQQNPPVGQRNQQWLRIAAQQREL